MTIHSDAEALFLSDLQPSDHPTGRQVADAIRRSIETHGDMRGCTGDFAAEYGEHPDSAAERMRWALGLVVDFRYPTAA